VKEHEKVDVIAHRLAPRAAAALKRELVPPKPKPEKKAGKPKASKIQALIVPAPAPPASQARWQMRAAWAGSAR